MRSCAHPSPRTSNLLCNENSALRVHSLWSGILIFKGFICFSLSSVERENLGEQESTKPAMSSSSSSSIFTFFFFFTFSLYFLSLPTATVAGTSSPSTVGVTYTTSHPPNPPPEQVASTVDTLKITALRLPESDAAVVRAFSYTNTSLFLSIPNTLVPALAANRSNALRWLYHHVVPFYPRARISTISVGNNILDASPELCTFLLPAITNVHLALRDLGIRKITVSSTFSFINIMTTAFPPSAAAFQEPYSGSVIKPLLQFLRDTNSSFLINLYPYNVYRLNSEIPIGFALFQEHPFNFRDDVTTGVRYWNLFDMMVDAVISAMAVAGHENIPVVVAETGWPSSGGDPGEVDATEAYSEIYLKGLLQHLKSGLGTPLRKEGVAETYVYELRDREVKQGNKQLRNWGILYPNMTKKYKLDFSCGVRNVPLGANLMYVVAVVVISYLMLKVVEAVIELLLLLQFSQVPPRKASVECTYKP